MSYASFTKAVLRVLWDGEGGLDGGDIQELGLEHGVIRETPNSPCVR